MKILVLDDHAGFRAEVIEMLTRNGHEAVGVGNAVDAIPLAEGGLFDLILVDFSMPEHDGLWFMRHIKLPQNTKALLMSANLSRPIINAMMQVGASGYIFKPFEEVDLLRHLMFHTPNQHHSPQPANR